MCGAFPRYRSRSFLEIIKWQHIECPVTHEMWHHVEEPSNGE